MMHSRFRRAAWILATLLALMATLTACGQKGDLYLPEPEPETEEKAQEE